MASALLVVGFAACENPNHSDKDRVHVTTEVEPRYTSYIDLSPPGGTYDPGDTVFVRAWGGGRFRFHEWLEGIHSVDSEGLDTLVVQHDMHLRARFTAGYLGSEPMASPNRHRVFGGHARDLHITLHENTHALREILWQGKQVPYRKERILQPPETEPLPDTWLVILPESWVDRLSPGEHYLEWVFEAPEVSDSGAPDSVVSDSGAPYSGALENRNTTRSLPMYIDVVGEERACDHDWLLASLYVDHGDALFMRLPNGETALIDTGTRLHNERYVLPFLKAHLARNEQGRQVIDHIIITHWHYDHFHGLDVLLDHFDVGSVRYNLAAPPNYYGHYDDAEHPEDPYGFGSGEPGRPAHFAPEHSNDFFVENRFELGGLQVTVLNAARHPDTETWNFVDHVHRNERSLALRMEYNGFVLVTGGDTYQGAQGAMLSHFPPKLLRSHVFHANHHFHGGISGEYLIVTDPQLFLASANGAVYDRDAYARVVLNEVIPYLNQKQARYTDQLLTWETGHTVVRIDGSVNWQDPSIRVPYESYFVNSQYPLQHQVPCLLR